MAIAVHVLFVRTLKAIRIDYLSQHQDNPQLCLVSLSESASIFHVRPSGIYLINGGTRVWLKFDLRDGAAAMSPSDNNSESRLSLAHFAQEGNELQQAPWRPEFLI